MNGEKIKGLFQITTDRMYTALGAFSIWKKMNQMMNVNEVGKDKAERNVEIFKKHWDFFHPILSSTYKSFVTDLSIFFDAGKYEDTFSLNKLINEIEPKISSVDKYDELVNKIEAIKRKHGVKISFILKLRNTGVSHQEIERKSRLIIYKDIEELFVGVQEILNLLSKHYNGSFTMWNHIGENVVHSFEWVIDNLERGEKAKLEEIMKLYPNH